MPDDNRTKHDPNFMDRGQQSSNPTIFNQLFGQQENGSGGHTGTIPDTGISLGFGGGNGEASRDPLAGFLVSFSRRNEGEFWAIHYGNNLIGSGANCKIKLNEQTVSGEHANINVRTDEENNCLYIQIIDKESKNGTYVNGKKVLEIGRGIEVKDGARIRVGEYEFYLVIVDKFVLKLAQNPDFKEKGGDSMDYSNQFFRRDPDGTRT